ncbi:MAG: efflux transporter periplasmic adaptor subunit [Bacteroidia bacterium]|nr:MAG: efflux transporter periplasmic adaptor subunit [Bacteroidia bacterium]
MNTIRNTLLAARPAVVALMMIVPFALAGCGGGKQAEKAAEAEAESKALRVKTYRAMRRVLDVSKSFSGLVAPFREDQVSPGMAGRIKRVLVDVGDRVKAGQRLVEMDPTQLLSQQTQLATLRVDFVRLDTLYKVGSVSQQQHDQMASQLRVMEQQVRNLTENTHIDAPISGVVTGRYYNQGELYGMAPTPASNGRAAILTVMQVDPVKVKINLSEELYPAVRGAQPVEVTLSTYPGKRFAATIYRKSPTVNPMSHSFDVEVQVPNAEGLLRPGMYANAKLSFGEREMVLVPDLAVQHQRGTNQRYVYVVEDGLARRVEVELGRRVDRHIVIEKGLRGDEEVIYTGLRELKDGARVEVVAQEQPEPDGGKPTADDKK